MSRPESRQWQFWIDRGGTFTDLVALRPNGTRATHKLLSADPERYQDAAVEGISRLLAECGETLGTADIACVRMGTTVATNALLERQGEPTLLVTNRGFGDLLRIGYQTRPRLFDRHIVLDPPLHEAVLEIECRVAADGQVLTVLQVDSVRRALEEKRRQGWKSAAIVLLHAFRFPEQEQAVAALARDAGFEQVSVSHEVSPLIRVVGRGDTTVADAYLSPVLDRYVRSLRTALGPTPLLFMQSNGGLVDADQFRGRDAVLSGPAGGIVGMARVAEAAGFRQVIGFDMGGTSTDVCHYAGQFERSHETEIAGVRLRVPMLDIHTVAAGGGSVCWFDGQRQRVGPKSAGAAPGPACYRNGGPLTITDCNLILGRIQADRFPRSFGPRRDQTLDSEASGARLSEIADAIEAATGARPDEAELAEGFVRIANAHMARAIKRVSLQRGHDAERCVLNSFGGAGGQHACAVSDALGIRKVLVHPLAGVLSALGMGLSERRSLQEQTLQLRLDEAARQPLEASCEALADRAFADLEQQGVERDQIRIECRAHVRYVGSDDALAVPVAPIPEMRKTFEAAFLQRFGFLQKRLDTEIDFISVEAIESGSTEVGAERTSRRPGDHPSADDEVDLVHEGVVSRAPVHQRDRLSVGQVVTGPALICEDTGTTVVDPGWRAIVDANQNLLLEREEATSSDAAKPSAETAQLEIFNTLFTAIAEQMGEDLRNSAHSVNIKERLDFSCALFDPDGLLVANAPHIPVHLGSMGDSVQAVIAGRRRDGRGLLAGDCWMLNAPYNGGTHLPDVTVVCPVFDDDGQLLGLVAARGHHADIGGIAPGSMPANSRHVDEEGILIDDFLLVDSDRLREVETRELLASGRWPARNPDQNIADLRAQLAACARGARALRELCTVHGIDKVRTFMRRSQDNAMSAVAHAVRNVPASHYALTLDNGSRISVRLRPNPDRGNLIVDFSESSPQLDDNFNAPLSVCRAAVLYVLRMLVDDHIPLNAGCLRPVDLRVPEGCMLNPRYPAAVVAGNVETSQVIVDVLLGALGLLSGSQGTMNNFSFGDARDQYYETLCGGTGAGADFNGASAVHSHMTNSRLTDVEVLETRLPVRVEQFAIRAGSGGRGHTRGGDGVSRRIRFNRAMQVSLLGNHRKTGPRGLLGGEDGAAGENRLIRASGQTELLPASVQIEVEAGDAIEVRTPGGAGYGRAED